MTSETTASRGQLRGKRIAFLATDGVERSELERPWQAVIDAGGQPELLSTRSGEIKAQSGEDQATMKKVARPVSDATAGEYEGLVIPGGTKSPDRLRTDDDAVAFVRAFFEAGKPVASICHGPWMLVEADVVRGRTLTSWPSLKTDIRNAGGTWVDEEVHVEDGLVTSRKPDDLPAFCRKMIEEFTEGRHERRRVPAGAATAR